MLYFNISDVELNVMRSTCSCALLPGLLLDNHRKVRHDLAPVQPRYPRMSFSSSGSQGLQILQRSSDSLQVLVILSVLLSNCLDGDLLARSTDQFFSALPKHAQTFVDGPLSELDPHIAVLKMARQHLSHHVCHRLCCLILDRVAGVYETCISPPSGCTHQLYKPFATQAHYVI